ncbi:C1 family peptidase [Bradyrhizobium sp. 13971]
MSKIVPAKDISSMFGPARNQLARPTCLAFAASDAHAALRSGWAPLSCEYIFFHAQLRANRLPSVGATLSKMLEAIHLDGQPEEIGWPYLSATPTDAGSWMPPEQVGALYRRNGKTPGITFDAIADEIANGHPVILLTMLSRSFFRPSSDGIVHPETAENPEPERRHAVIGVGHGTADGHRAILVRNSWGAGWGLGGYAWLTEAFLKPRLFAIAMLTEDLNVPANTPAE